MVLYAISLSICFTPVGHQEKRSRNFSSFSSAFFEPKGVEELNSKGCFWNWLSSKVWQRFKKKGVSWVNLSLLIYYWWIEVASDGFLAWCDLMPRAFGTLGGQDDTSEARTGSRRRVLSSTRSVFFCWVIDSQGSFQWDLKKQDFLMLCFYFHASYFLGSIYRGRVQKIVVATPSDEIHLELKRPILLWPSTLHMYLETAENSCQPGFTGRSCILRHGPQVFCTFNFL